MEKPEDPEDDYYLINCFVCEEIAKPGNSHMRNYGGTVCFSCRQFFRRAQQGNHHPDFTCKGDGKCHITVSNRRKCQKCRYERCLQSGMCPDAVLTEQEKKIRFQRMLRKRGVLAVSNSQNSETKNVFSATENDTPKKIRDNSTDEMPLRKIPKLIPIVKGEPQFYHIEHNQLKQQQLIKQELHQEVQEKYLLQQQQLLQQQKLQQQKQEREYQQQLLLKQQQKLQQQKQQEQQQQLLLLHQQQQQQQLLQLKQQQQFQIQQEKLPLKLVISKSEKLEKEVNTDPISPTHDWPSFLKSKVQYLQKSYEQSISDIENSEFQCCLSNLNEDQLPGPIRQGNILELMGVLKNQFGNFALHQSQFMKMNKEDQRKLLSKNTPLFIQLTMAFLLKSGCRRQILDEMFQPASNLSDYLLLVEKLEGNLVKTLQVKAVLAFILLLDCADDRIELCDNVYLDDLNILNSMMFQHCITKSTEEFSLQEFSQTLKRMAEFSAKNFKWRAQRSSQVITREITAFYTLDEEVWLQSNLKMIQKLLWSVPIGEDLLKEFLLFSIDVTPSQSFLQAICLNFKERIWKVLELHEEFQGLNEQVKFKQVGDKGAGAVALLLSRMDVLPTGVSQCQELLGNYPALEIYRQCQFLLTHSTKMKRFWLEKSCCNIISCSQIRKLSFLDLCHVGGKNDLLSNMSNNFSDLLFDPVIFKVMLLLILTAPESDSSTLDLTKLRHFYLKTLFRRLRCYYRKGTCQAAVAVKFIVDATTTYQKLSHSVNDLFC